MNLNPRYVIQYSAHGFLWKFKQEKFLGHIYGQNAWKKSIFLLGCYSNDRSIMSLFFPNFLFVFASRFEWAPTMLELFYFFAGDVSILGAINNSNHRKNQQFMYFHTYILACRLKKQFHQFWRHESRAGDHHDLEVVVPLEWPLTASLTVSDFDLRSLSNFAKRTVLILNGKNVSKVHQQKYAHKHAFINRREKLYNKLILEKLSTLICDINTSIL